MAMEENNIPIKENIEKLWIDSLYELSPECAAHAIELIKNDPILKPCLTLKQSEVEAAFADPELILHVYNKFVEALCKFNFCNNQS